MSLGQAMPVNLPDLQTSSTATNSSMQRYGTALETNISIRAKGNITGK